MGFSGDQIASRCHKLEVAFASVPMVGHLTPLLPYAEELLRRGHSVTFFHESDPKYRRKLENCGLAACQSVTYLQKKIRPGGSDALFRCIVDHYSVDGARPPSVVVYEFFATDAADAADMLGVPAICVFPNPVSANPWAASAEDQDTYLWALWCNVIHLMEAVVARALWLQRAYTRWSRKLPMLTEQDLYPSRYMPRPMIGCTSPEIEFNVPNDSGLFTMVGPTLPTLFDSIGRDLDAWLCEQEKIVIYVAFGTMRKHSAKDVKTLQYQLLGQDVAVLWSLPAEEQRALDTESVPPHWRIESYFPQVALFRSGKIGAFVSHCGSNSTYEALLHGVPMVCCPGKADQPANAARLARAGAGVIARGGLTGVGVALEKLLADLDGMITRTREVAEGMRSGGGAEKAASLIEDVASAADDGTKGKITFRRTPWFPVILLLGVVPLLHRSVIWASK